MADIFLSYSREDRPRVEPLAEALVSAGYSVWWDRNLAGGSRYLNETEAELKAAKAVLVVWTKASVGSHWVADEAGAGRDTGRLLPISLDGVQPPLGFRQFQVIDFHGWKPGHEAQFAELRSALGRLIASTDAPPPPAIKPSSRPLLKRPVVIGALAAAFIAVIAAVVMFGMRPQTGSSAAASSNQLIAFFGFTPASDDPTVKATAEAATDWMFQRMLASRLAALARNETKNVPEDKRFAHATDRGALYTLAGEVRSGDDGGLTLALRFDDVPSRTMLWEKTFTSAPENRGYLPAQAARLAVEVMWCITATRSAATRDSRELLSLIADRCRQQGTSTSRRIANSVGRMRDIVQADPESAYNQAQLAIVLGSGVTYAPASAQAAWIAEAEAALERARKIDPNAANVGLAYITVVQGKSVPAEELDKVVLEVLAETERRDEPFVVGQANGTRYDILRTVGQFREARPYLAQASANNPYIDAYATGVALAMVGQTAEARAELAPVLAAYGPDVWADLAPYALFLGAPDPGPMLAKPPSTIPQTTADCFKDIHRALSATSPQARLQGARRARECGDAGAITTFTVLAAVAALGDLDAAFAMAEQEPFNSAKIGYGIHQVLFWPTSRAMRADPRFLPLVEKLGLMDYWRATKSQPDSCGAEDVPFCRELKKTAKP